MDASRDRRLDILAALGAAGLGFLGLRRLGLADLPALAILAAIVAGGAIDIPLPRFPGRSTSSTARTSINLGGGVIPLALAAILAVGLSAADRRVVAIDAAAVAAASWLLARREPERGIVVPWIYPGLLSAALATVTGSPRPAVVAYSAAVLGTFLGADLLHLRSLRKIGALRIGLGGAGPGDGLVWSGLLAALVAGGIG